MSIRKLVKDTLSHAEILNLTSNGYVYFLKKSQDVQPPYVTYRIYDEGGEDWTENREVATNYYVQVDIFSKGSYSELERLIKEKMINACFIRTASVDLYEEETELYHKAIRFLFTQNNI
ncbi:prohead protease [Clostridium sp. D2Q-11]|uniref:Prohead protease n=1 Tax=Anaeromonas frigoriresistens TaxID=2683708 RepID=A0A942UZU8_9FIRM|nr:prohead protease [Anaeromonas frigoriresistens]MBS4539824.1 prohead protease [Anaeromonas frigoriresistens]